MALQWVKDNIQYFGGDPDRIILMGESGGAQVVSLMCVSPLTKGLFSRAIIQSANIVKHIYNNLDGNMALGERLAEAVNCTKKNFTIYDHPSDVVHCMRGKINHIDLDVFFSFRIRPGQNPIFRWSAPGNTHFIV